MEEEEVGKWSEGGREGLRRGRERERERKEPRKKTVASLLSSNRRLSEWEARKRAERSLSPTDGLFKLRQPPPTQTQTHCAEKANRICVCMCQWVSEWVRCSPSKVTHFLLCSQGRASTFDPYPESGRAELWWWGRETLGYSLNVFILSKAPQCNVQIPHVSIHSMTKANSLVFSVSSGGRMYRPNVLDCISLLHIPPCSSSISRKEERTILKHLSFHSFFLSFLVAIQRGLSRFAF